jgi:hypothetical protein
MRIGRILDSYFDLFSRRNSNPTNITKLVWKLRSELSRSWGTEASLPRYLFMQNQIPDSPISTYSKSSVEILYVAKAEDIQLLNLSIMKSIKNTLNEIRRVTVIVPEIDRVLVENSLKSIEYDIKVISESLIVDLDVFNLIKARRPDRFGWILQQVLVAQYILKTDSENVLVVDADTIITNPQVWVGDDRSQILLPTYELHKPYYDFFQLKSSKYPSPQNSFVSHHMLIQSNIFREVFGIWNGSVKEALVDALNYADKDENSPFDLKYEIYAQYLVSNYPELVIFVKWANLSLPVAGFLSISSSENRLTELQRHYNSISFHHWNTV